MLQLHDLIPDVNLLLQLDPEELGGLLLQIIAERGPQGLHLINYESELFGHRPAYPRERSREVMQAIAEAWAWLEGQALIVWPDPHNGQHGWRMASRRGRRVAEPADWAAYRQASLLPKQILHPAIAETIFFSFARGEYQKKIGYVGFGVVREPSRMVRDIKIKGTLLLDLPLVQPGLSHSKDDPEVAEYAVLIDWKKDFPLKEAKTFDGAFANQNIVCRLTHPQTIEFLEKEFGPLT